MNPAWVSAAVALACALGVAVWRLSRVFWRVFRKTEAFLEDWNGNAASPGHPKQPGVMERLVDLESGYTQIGKRFDSQDKTLEQIKAEVMYNSGHSLKDTVTVLRDKVEVIAARLDTFDPGVKP